MEESLAVATDRDGDRERIREGGLPQGDAERPRRVLVELVEDEPRLLRLQLVEQLATGHVRHATRDAAQDVIRSGRPSDQNV